MDLAPPAARGQVVEQQQIGRTGAKAGVWLVSAEQWPRACLRAELIERGYEAVGFVSVQDMLEALRAERRKPAAIVLDLRGQGLGAEQLRALAGAQVPLGAIGGTVEAAEEPVRRFPWTVLLRRPVTLGAVADVVARMVRDSRTGA